MFSQNFEKEMKAVSQLSFTKGPKNRKSNLDLNARPARANLSKAPTLTYPHLYRNL